MSMTRKNPLDSCAKHPALEASATPVASAGTATSTPSATTSISHSEVYKGWTVTYDVARNPQTRWHADKGEERILSSNYNELRRTIDCVEWEKNRCEQ